MYLNPIVCFNMFDILLIDRKETVMSPATCHFYFILFKHYSLHNHCFYFLVYAPTFYFTFRFCLQETRFLCSLFGLSSFLIPNDWELLHAPNNIVGAPSKQ